MPIAPSASLCSFLIATPLKRTRADGAILHRTSGVAGLLGLLSLCGACVEHKGGAESSARVCYFANSRTTGPVRLHGLPLASVPEKFDCAVCATADTLHQRVRT